MTMTMTTMKVMTDRQGCLPIYPVRSGRTVPRAADPRRLHELLRGSPDERMGRVIDACGWLARNGCQVLAAHVIDGLPRVCAAPPVPLTGAMRRRTATETVLVGIARGVLVEWRTPR